MKLTAPTLLLISFILISSFLQLAIADVPTPIPGGRFCQTKCKARCAKAGMADRCLTFCGICCVECKCVPSGTFGNKHECPCYRDKKTKRGKPKCP